MLNLILGTDWIANRDEVLRRIALDVKAKKEHVILLVPELISHDTERRLCEVAGDTASRYAEVLSFTRLLRRVSEQEQKKIPECLDSGGRLVAMASAVQMTSSRLKSYADLETKPEFLTGLVEAVDEFKRCRITAADLTAASESSSGMLAQKLSELSLILDAYDGVCAQGKQDPRQQMEWLLDELECCDFARNHTFYIDGFPDLTRQNMAILTHLIRSSPSVTVSLNCDQLGSERAAFEKAGETAKELKRLAVEHDIRVETQYIPARQDGLNQVREKLFQGQITQEAELSKRLQMVRSDSVFDECMAAADRIRELVQSGARYRDIGVGVIGGANAHGVHQVGGKHLFNRGKYGTAVLLCQGSDLHGVCQKDRIVHAFFHALGGVGFGVELQIGALGGLHVGIQAGDHVFCQLLAVVHIFACQRHFADGTVGHLVTGCADKVGAVDVHLVFYLHTGNAGEVCGQHLGAAGNDGCVGGHTH